VDNLRAIEGVQVAALVYARPEQPGGQAAGSDQEVETVTEYRVSLRSSSDELDVQQIARARGGGGHRQAAGYTATGETTGQIVDYLTDSVATALARLKSTGQG